MSRKTGALSKSSNQIVGIDLLRFCAAFMVMVYHLAFWSWNANGTAHKVIGTPHSYFEAEPYAWFGWIGVQIFFAISGFVIPITAAASTPWRFLRNRISRLFPTIFICATISFVLLSILGLQDVSKYIRAVFIIPYGPWLDGVYWTLTVEVVFYGLVWLQLLLFPHRMEILLIIIGSASSVYWLLFFLGVPYALALADTRHVQLLLLAHGCHFAIGGMIWLISSQGFRMDRGLLLVLFVLAGAIDIAAESDRIDLIPLSIWAVALVAIALSAMLNRPVKWQGVARVIGLLTFPLYLLHNVFGALLMKLLLMHNPWLALGAGMMGSILLALFVLGIEPSLRWILGYSLRVLFPSWHAPRLRAPKAHQLALLALSAPLPGAQPGYQILRGSSADLR
jgi:peptidoglycan/LPS O-acetylase OafA/YrhL